MLAFRNLKIDRCDDEQKKTESTHTLSEQTSSTAARDSTASILRTSAFLFANSLEAFARVRETTATKEAGRTETEVATAYVAIERGTLRNAVVATTTTAKTQASARSA